MIEKHMTLDRHKHTEFDILYHTLWLIQWVWRKHSSVHAYT